MNETLPIASIRVGARHRKDMGDIEGLAARIKELGLLHPIVVHPDGRLIAGERRLAACTLLGWDKVPVTLIDIVQIARGEAAENFDRKDFTPSEAVAIKRELEPAIKAAAQERMMNGKPSAKLAKGRTRHKAVALTGMDGQTLDKAEAIVAAAEAEPERFGKLLDDMDRTGRVDGPFKRLKVMKQAEAIRKEPPPLPNKGPYRVLVCDPPWPYELRQEDPSHRGVLPYTSMSIDQIRALNVAAIAHEDCILWLWTTNHHMREAFTVLDAWGFQQKTILTWVKDKMGMGDWLRGQSEHCLMAVRGNPIVQLTNQTTILHGKVRQHSRKPESFYDFVEKLCPAPRYGELFSRHDRKDWDGHGDEVGVHA